MKIASVGALLRHLLDKGLFFLDVLFKYFQSLLLFLHVIIQAVDLLAEAPFVYFSLF